DRHIPRPTYAKHQSETLHQREQAIDQSAGSRDDDLALVQLADFYRKIRPKLSFRIEPKMVKKILVLRRQVIVRQSIGRHRKGREKQSFEQLDGNDDPESRGPLLKNL